MHTPPSKRSMLPTVGAGGRALVATDDATDDATAPGALSGAAVAVALLAAGGAAVVATGALHAARVTRKGAASLRWRRTATS
jgi:hypothetical protein